MVEYFETILSSKKIVVIMLTLIIMIIFLFCYYIYVCHSLKKICKHEIDNHKIYKNKKNAIRRKNICFALLVFVIICFFVMNYFRKRIVLMDDKYSNGIKTDAYNRVFDNDKSEGVFSVESAEPDEKEMVFDLHLDWCNEKEKGNKETVKEKNERYWENVNYIYNAIPSLSESVSNSVENPEISEMRERFFEYIKESPESKSADDCWKQYQLGREIMKIFKNSEIVFQTAVLAENAFDKAVFNGEQEDVVIKYAIGAVECFEIFLKYPLRYAGNGIEVDECDVAFRIGKIVYRIFLYKHHVDENIKLHYILYAYNCFRYDKQEVNKDDKRYEKFIYYQALCCIEIYHFSENKKYGKELCINILRDWNDLEKKKKCTKWDVESQSGKEIKQVRKNLERIVS